MTTTTITSPSTRRWRASSFALIALTWAVLQLGGLFSPGLLDDVDSIYTQVAREMLQRHDYVTPTIDGIRFFDKPPLMYWMAAASMRIFGTHDWAARLPLALGVLALLLAVYALGIRLFNPIRTGAPSVTALGHGWGDATSPDRGGLYAALALATSLGTYLYTRFYIPDILIALWMTLSVHLFLLALDRVKQARSPLIPSLGFAAVMALDVLTKGLIGIVFPLAFVVLYLGVTGRLRLLLKFKIPAATGLFLLLAAPWHILAALRNPAIAMPAGVGLPARAGWAWFYLYNEHIARFLGRRIPHDYGNVPIPYFWMLLLLWLLPWVAFLPAALASAVRVLRSHRDAAVQFDSDPTFSHFDNLVAPSVTAPGRGWASQDLADAWTPLEAADRRRESVLACLLWAGIILGFFTLSARQEYYHLPALPALALLVGGLLAAADNRIPTVLSSTLRASLYMLVPLGTMLFVICGYLALTAPTPRPGVSLDALLSTNPDLYNLSLGHVFDLTTQAMGFFRGPLLTVALGFLALGPVAYFVRRRNTFAANLLITAAMAAVLLAAHEGLARFYPILGSKDLAEAIHADDPASTASVLIDGELTSGSSLLFYLDNPVLLVNGHVNGPWFGSLWPDARPIFLTDADLVTKWHSTQSLYLLTYHPEQRIPQLCQSGPVILVAKSGGKSVLRNGTTRAHVSEGNICH